MSYCYYPLLVIGQGVLLSLRAIILHYGWLILAHEYISPSISPIIPYWHVIIPY